MPQPNVLILRAPGTNCDGETTFAFEQAGAKAELLHINRLLDSPSLLARFQILCIPGGFSYGDDVAGGRILGNQIRHHLADQMAEFKAEGKLILGICNGFQALIKSGVLLEPDAENGPPATLTFNDSGKFEDRWVRLDVRGTKCVFLAGIDSMYLPVAHGEGKFVARDDEVLEQLEADGQLVLRYTRQFAPALATPADSAQPTPADSAQPTPADSAQPKPADSAQPKPADCGQPTPADCGQRGDRDEHSDPFGDGSRRVPYPDNPNGSVADVAGICDATGRVLGLMPHPERHIDPTQHPRWTRGEAGPVGDGLKVFINAVEYFA